MKRSVKIAIIAGIAVAVIVSALAITVHLRLSAIEGSETKQESTSEKIKESLEVISNPNAKPESSESEENESLEHAENANESASEGMIKCQGTALCISGEVERVIDGDTIVVKGTKVRLSLVNTPEKDEPGFDEATEFTSRLCPVGSNAVVDQDDGQPYDVYDRLVGKVTCSGKILNAELLYSDQATILTKYCSKSEFSSESWATEYGC